MFATPSIAPLARARNRLRGSALLLAAACAFGPGLLVGCARSAAATKADLSRVDAACAKGDVEAARAALAEAAERSRAFRDAYEDAKASWGGADPTRLNPCGVILEDLRRRLGQN